MKEKELRRLKRVELLDMLIEQGRLVDAQAEEITKLRAQVEELKVSLEDRRLSLEKAGSIAEASLKIAGVFEAAQEAAKIYLENLQEKSGSSYPVQKAFEEAKLSSGPSAEDAADQNPDSKGGTGSGEKA